MQRARTTLFATAAVLLLVGAGCGQTVTQKVTEKATESVINHQLGNKGTVDLNDNSVTYKGNDGATVAYGENAKMPDNFPTDTPSYPGAAVNVAATQADGSASLSLHTKDKSDAVLTWYAGKLSDWKQTASYSAGGQEMRTYEKDNVTLTLIVTTADDGAAITLGRSVKNPPQQ